jgi:hypothetical protein
VGGEHWDVAEELTALGGSGAVACHRQEVLHNRAAHPSIAQYEEAASSYSMDMELRDPSDEEGEEDERDEGREGKDTNMIPLLSHDSIVKMRQEMGMYQESNDGGDTPAHATQERRVTSTTTTLSIAVPVIPSPMPSSTPKLPPKEDLGSDQGRESYLFFSQNSTFGNSDMEAIEAQVAHEGQEIQKIISSTNTNVNYHTSRSPVASVSEISSSAASALMDSQQEFLAFLASQNEANKTARPFVHHPTRPPKPSPKPMIEDKHTEEVEETEMATQQQMEYVATPSPSSSKKQGSASTSTAKEAARVSFSACPDVNQVTKKTRKTRSKTALQSSNAGARGSVSASQGDDMIQEATQGDVSFSFSPMEQSWSGGRGEDTDRESKRDREGGSSEFERQEGKYVGRRISKQFSNLGWFPGTVVSYAEYVMHRIKLLHITSHGITSHHMAFMM